MTDGSADPSLQEAERRGFNRGLNVGLLSVSLVSAAAASWRSFVDVPRFEQVFRQVKAPMPGLTLLVFSTHQIAAALLVLGSLVCIWRTRTRGQERSTIVLNSVLFGASLLWLAIVTISMYGPFMMFLDGIGQNRN